MAIIIYECDTCNRKVEKQQNEQGLEVFGRCIITNGCKGSLHKFGEKPLHVIPNIPPKEDGLDDWIQRKVLYNHEQLIKTREWRIVHNMGLEPSVQVHIERIQNDKTTILEEVVPLTTTFVDGNTIVITFDENQSGVVQCIGRSSSGGQVTQYIDEVPPVAKTEEVLTQITTDGVLVIGISHTILIEVCVNVNFIQITDPDRTIQQFPILFKSNTNVEGVTSPWFNNSQVLVNGTLYNLYTANIEPEGLNNQPHSVYIEILTDGVADAELTAGTIAMITDAPYSDVDRNFEKYAVLKDSSFNNASGMLVYEKGVLSGYESIIGSSFPPIRVTR